MLSAGHTQPLSTPWRRSSKAAHLHISYDRVASLVVEDLTCPVPRLHARVFEVELIARLILTTADGSTLEKRTIRARACDGEQFADRVCDAAAWATEQHPDIAITVEEHAGPLPAPADVNLDRRRRVA